MDCQSFAQTCNDLDTLQDFRPEEWFLSLNGFDMISSIHWKRGPEFLWQDESAWPTNPAVPEIACEDEEVKNQVRCCVSNVQMTLGILGDTAIQERIKNKNRHDPFHRELLFLASSEKESGLAASLQGLAESEDEKQGKATFSNR